MKKQQQKQKEDYNTTVSSWSVVCDTFLDQEKELQWMDSALLNPSLLFPRGRKDDEEHRATQQAQSAAAGKK